MLQFDQENGPARQSAHGLSRTAAQTGRLLDEIAREIEDTQRQQSETMAQIVDRLRAADKIRSTEGRSAADLSTEMPAPPRQYVVLDQAGDEPWDADAAEALMQTYEDSPKRDDAGGQMMSTNQQAWIGERFNDVTQRITQALSDLKPGGTMTLLEERLDAFQGLISTSLQDVVRRADIEGMRLIETHVHDLGDKLDELERHVSRIDGIESDVRNVIEQVSDERIAKLLDYDSRFAADLEAVARMAAEQVQGRLAQGSEPGLADTRRHEELRALIEHSIADRREAEVQAVSLVTGLSGRVSAQAERYDELKGLIEQAIQEQRQSEHTAFGMLDTLQQALVTVLDRIDALEHQHHSTALVGPPPSDGPASRATFEAPYDAEGALVAVDPIADEAPYAFRDTRFDSFGAKDGADERLAPVEIPAAFAETDGAAHLGASEDSESPLDRLRRDFVADARRAKMKAAASRAETPGEQGEPDKANAIAQARAALTRAPAASAAGRMFGMPTKLLAGVLALIIAINGGLLLLNRKAPPAAPEIARPAATEPHGTPDSRAPATKMEQPAGAPNPGPRSGLDTDDAGSSAPKPYGFHDDVLDPPQVEATASATTPDTPHGTTLSLSVDALPEEAVAGIYEQQVLASLSGKLGMIAAGQSANALLPEENGRIDAAYPAPELAPGNDGTARTGALDMPPATVGPMSLRIAAANGDASAEFEVAARLAEGNGTNQNYAEALRWYQRAAAKGFAQAQYRLGTLYERGLGVTKDVERAKVWYGRAAEGGNVKAMHNLAVLIAGSDQGEPDYAAAATWFLKAAEHGLADSQYNLGVLLENGLGGAADRVAAYKWYALAAKGGDQDATQRRDALKAALAASEIASAEKLIATFRARVAAPLANDARAAGEDWKKRVNNDTNT
jgi:localization factor PodJL